MLKQAIREAACGSAYIQSCPSGNIDLELSQSLFKLQPSPADIGHLFPEDPDIGITRNERTRLFHFLAVHQNIPCDDHCLAAFAALHQAAVNEEPVNTDLDNFL
jgi:hypothetical protein